MEKVARRSTLAVTAMTLLLACGDGRGPVEPNPRSANEALGEPKCLAVGERDEPLVVDWKGHDRANLEAAMATGVAVVHYECGALRVLSDCHLDGSYRYLGVSRKEQVVELSDADDIGANLPAFGRTIAASLDRGSTLDLAMVLVGKQRTTVAEVKREMLRGSGDACQGATHFVRGAFVGAFALGTSTRGKVLASFSDVVGAGTSSSTLAGFRDGDPSACRSSSADDTQPPSGCSALVRLELAPIGGKASEEPTCPAGTVMRDGACSKADVAKTAAHTCKEDDVEDCSEQCKKGDLRSCHRLAFTHYEGKGGARKDAAAAAAIFKKNCESGYGDSCDAIGVLHVEGDGVAKDPLLAVRYLQRGCEGPDRSVNACVNLALRYQHGQGVVRDQSRAAAIFRKACDGGEARGCMGLGMLYADGAGVPRDGLRAAALFKQSCDGGFAAGCHNLAAMYANGEGVAPNPARARQYFQKACDDGHEDACESVKQFRETKVKE